MRETPDENAAMGELDPQSFGLPSDLVPGAVILTSQAHRLLEGFFFGAEGVTVDEWFPWHLQVLAGVAETVVVAPRVFTDSGLALGDSPRRWALLPTVEFWEPMLLAGNTQGTGWWIFKKLLEAGRSVALEAARGQGVTDPRFLTAMRRWAHESSRCCSLVLADAFGVSVRLTDYDAMALGYVLIACGEEIRPPAEPTALMLLKKIEELRTAFFAGVSKDFCFDYYDLHLPAILAVALREARTDEPTSLLDVLQQMREERTAAAFRSWASSVDQLVERPRDRENMLLEARALLRQLASDLSDPTRATGVSLEVSPLPPFLQLILGDPLFERVRGAYRRRKAHLAFMRSVYSESLQVGRMADDIVRVFGISTRRAGEIQAYVRRAFAPPPSGTRAKV